MPRDRYPRHVVVHVPPPRLHRLVRVVPVGATQAHRGVAVLALALEVYEAGFVATFQIQSLGSGPDLGDADDAERSPRRALMAGPRMRPWDIKPRGHGRRLPPHGGPLPGAGQVLCAPVASTVFAQPIVRTYIGYNLRWTFLMFGQRPSTDIVWPAHRLPGREIARAAYAVEVGRSWLVGALGYRVGYTCGGYHAPYRESVSVVQGHVHGWCANHPA